MGRIDLNLSIVLPCFNESNNIQAVLKNIDQFFALNSDGHPFRNVTLIVVDDGSEDDSLFKLNSVRFRCVSLKCIHHEKNEGYGSAVRSGIMASSADYIFVMDGDGQYSIHEFLNYWKAAEHFDADAVFGVRIRRCDPRLRILLSQFWNFIIRHVLGVRVKDIGCGQKLFRARSIMPPHQFKAKGAFIWPEIAHCLFEQKATVKFVPIVHSRRRHGTATGDSIKVIGRSICELFHFVGRLKGAPRGLA